MLGITQKTYIEKLPTLGQIEAGLQTKQKEEPVRSSYCNWKTIGKVVLLAGMTLGGIAATYQHFSHRSPQPITALNKLPLDAKQRFNELLTPACQQAAPEHRTKDGTLRLGDHIDPQFPLSAFIDDEGQVTCTVHVNSTTIVYQPSPSKWYSDKAKSTFKRNPEFIPVRLDQAICDEFDPALTNLATKHGNIIRKAFNLSSSDPLPCSVVLKTHVLPPE